MLSWRLLAVAGLLLLQAGCTGLVRDEGVYSSKAGSRLGYDRGTLERPWLLKVAFGYWHRGARYVAWERIRSLGTDRIVITGTAGDLPHPTPTG